MTLIRVQRRRGAGYGGCGRRSLALFSHAYPPRLPHMTGRALSYGSVCSGIEAATAAWQQHGGECHVVDWLSHFNSPNSHR